MIQTLIFTILFTARLELLQLTAEYKAVNLGEGFPDFPLPSFVQEALSNAINGGFHMHQYTRGHVRELFFFHTFLPLTFFSRFLKLICRYFLSNPS